MLAKWLINPTSPARIATIPDTRQPWVGAKQLTTRLPPKAEARPGFISGLLGCFFLGCNAPRESATLRCAFPLAERTHQIRQPAKDILRPIANDKAES